MIRRTRIPGPVQQNWDLSPGSASSPHERRALGAVALQSKAFALPSGLVANYDLWHPQALGAGILRNNVTSPADGSARSAYDLFLGTTAAVQTSDPAIANSSSISEACLQFSTGQTLTLSSGTNTTFIESMHKLSAEFTLEFLIKNQPYSATTTDLNQIFQTRNTAGNIGVEFLIRPGGQSGKIFAQTWAGTGPGIVCTSNVSFPAGCESELTYVAFSYKDSLNAGFWNMNGVSTAFSGFRTGTPSTSAATSALGISGSSGGVRNLLSGTSVYFVRLYNRALTDSEILQNYRQCIKRFPTLP